LSSQQPLAGCDFTQCKCKKVDLRGARLAGLKGVGSLAGSTIAVDQLFGLAPDLAKALGIIVRTEAGSDEEKQR
jgi:hypothetical protein